MRSTWVLSLGATLLLGACLLGGGCEDNDWCDHCGYNPYLPQTSPDNVLNNFQVAWRTRDVEAYARLLADDFRFYFDDRTRQQLGLPIYWDRATEGAQVDRLFANPRVSDIALLLRWPVRTTQPATEAGRERWVYYDILALLLDVDMAPTPENSEGVTYRVEDQRQRFYFRKGRTEADTLGTSATANQYYIVEWRDFGVASPGEALTFAEDQNTTWGAIKAVLNQTHPIGEPT